MVCYLDGMGGMMKESTVSDQESLPIRVFGNDNDRMGSREEMV